MKRIFWTSILMLILSAAASAQALPDSPEPVPASQDGWSRIQDLARGQEISVSTPGSYSEPCLFAGATGELLFCVSRFSDREYRFNRSEVSAIRMDDRRRNMRILLGGFSAAGLIWGVARQPSPGVPRAIDGLAGAALGGLAGWAISVPGSLLMPGRLVYRHPQAGRTARAGATQP